MQTLELKSADGLRAAWRCGEHPADRAPLAKREAGIAEAYERLMGLPSGSCPGCPFEGVLGGLDVTGGWLPELLDARALVSDEHFTWVDALDGRPLAAVDRDALLAYKRADARLMRLERNTPPPTKKGGDDV